MADHAARVAATVREPLCLAVAGRVSSGKSTLVNALLGRRVAPTRETECTKLVTWYRHGPVEKVDVVLRRGGTRTVRLTPEGRLPEDVGAPTADVERLEVRLPVAALERLTIVDTPGLASATGGHSARTEAALGTGRRDDADASMMDARSTEATGRADAVLFVFAASLRADERDTIGAFRRTTSPVGSPSPVNTLGVLTKADLLTDPGDDPWPVAERLAADFRTRLVHEVTEVVPVSGLLAETVAAGAFTEADADALDLLAALDDRSLRRLLRTADAFRTRDVPVSGAVRASLLARLSLYGVDTAIAAVRGGARTAAGLTAVLAGRSRLQDVRGVVEKTFAARADALKASAALARLGRMAWDRSLSGEGRAWLGDQVELLRLDPAMHAIAELHALGELTAGRARLPGDLEVEFRRLVDADREDGPVPSSHAELRGLGERFARFAFDAAPADAHVARVAARSIHLRRTDGSTR
ncbi:dynamin family protein [Geodermatophilus pulveris]|uniref:dynamin family protein n=1 Tax=Geodermatophilus pulveris TaxID=1564159 RepID=UPI001179A64A|nr:dynamin family protein [Geodermatophilus pulveris]